MVVTITMVSSVHEEELVLIKRLDSALTTLTGVG